MSDESIRALDDFLKAEGYPEDKETTEHYLKDKPHLQSISVKSCYEEMEDWNSILYIMEDDDF